LKSELKVADVILKKDKKILNRAEKVVDKYQKKDYVKYNEYLYLYDKLKNLMEQIYFISKISDTYQTKLIKTREELEEKIAENSKVEQQLNEKIKELKNISTRDQLTGLYNRREFEKVIKDEWRYAIRESEPISLIMIDIDNFKAFNDNYGHLAGDNCLQKISKTMENALKRPRDFLARFGGEEFVVILPETDEAGAKHMAERIRKKVFASKIPHKYSNVEDYLTISLGVAHTDDAELFLFEELLDEADKALYKAKENGRNKYCFNKLTF